MLIAICDDEYIYRKELHDCIVEYKQNRRIKINVKEFENGNELLSSDELFDVVFLDYKMPGLNGMQIAHELRSRNVPCAIVFVTNYPEFVYEAFEVCPYRFFRKPIVKDNIKELLDSFLSEQKNDAPIVVIESGEQRVIPTKEIVYLEGAGKNCIVRTTKETFYSSKTLSVIFEELHGSCFFRVHKSYAINMHYISFFNNKCITFHNGEKALISRAYLSDFKRAYSEFLEISYLKI